MDCEKTLEMGLNFDPVNWPNLCEANDAIPLDLKYRPADALTRNGGRQ